MPYYPFVPFISLIVWKSIHFQSLENTKNTAAGDSYVVVPLQICLNLPRAKVIGLPEIDDLGYYVTPGGPGTVQRTHGKVPQATLPYQGIAYTSGKMRLYLCHNNEPFLLHFSRLLHSAV